MKMHHVQFVIILLVTLSTRICLAGMGDVTNVSRNGDTLTITAGSDILIVHVCDHHILEVDYRPAGNHHPDTRIIGNTNWPAVNAAIDTTANPMTITTDNMIVEINKTPCRLALYNPDHHLLVKEQDAEGVNPYGLRLEHPTGQNFYGIGGFAASEDSSPKMLRNTGGYVHAGAQGDCGGPFVWSNKGYGLLVDSDGGRFNINNTELIFSECSKVNYKYYLFADTIHDVFDGLAAVSGPAPMLPKWAMGFMNSEWGINQNELENLINTYRSKQIPIDAFILDYDWMLYYADDYGDWKWNPGNFPDGPSGTLASDMANQGIKLIGIRKPRLSRNTAQGQFALANGWYWDSDAINFQIDDCRLWWWNQHIGPGRAFTAGIVGWWNDEAEQNNWQFLCMQQALYEGQRSNSDLRVWSTNRNHYTGSQRYAYTLWSGDINTGFNNMANQRERMLASVNLGQVKWAMDIGGFHGTPNSQNYARWMQFGAFVPVYRVHGSINEQRQPWYYGTQAEAVAKAAIELRYQLIPYIYSYERRTLETGVGLVTPLVMQYPDDTNAANRYQEWLFGDWLLVAPVVDENQSNKSIYLPDGEWIDYFRGDSYTGPVTINYSINSATWEDIPLFIRKGAIIATQPVMNYVGEQPVDTITFSIFPDTQPTRFNYYDDDGLTYDYETGEYLKQTITTLHDGAASVQVNISDPEGSYQPPDLQYYLCKIYSDTSLNSITSNGNPLTEYTSLTELENATGEGFATGNDPIHGPAVYVKVNATAAKDILVSDVPPPDPPTNLNATSTTGSEIVLTWTDNSNDETGFVIQRKPWHGQTDWQTITTRPANTTSYTDTDTIYGLLNYTYRVGAYKN